MRVEQRELLRTMHDVDGVVDVQRHLARRAGMAGAIDVDHGVAQGGHLVPVRRVLPARDGRLRAQICTALRKASAGQLESGIAAQMVEIVAVLIAARDGQDAGAQDIGHAVRHKVGSRGSAIRAASLSTIPRRRSAAASSITPPSDVMRPPSNAAVTFLRATAGKWNGSRLSSDMAGVAREVAWTGWLRHPIQ